MEARTTKAVINLCSRAKSNGAHQQRVAKEKGPAVTGVRATTATLTCLQRQRGRIGGLGMHLDLRSCRFALSWRPISRRDDSPSIRPVLLRFPGRGLPHNRRQCFSLAQIAKYRLCEHFGQRIEKWLKARVDLRFSSLASS